MQLQSITLPITTAVKFVCWRIHCNDRADIWQNPLQDDSTTRGVLVYEENTIILRPQRRISRPAATTTPALTLLCANYIQGCSLNSYLYSTCSTSRYSTSFFYHNLYSLALHYHGMCGRGLSKFTVRFVGVWMYVKLG